MNLATTEEKELFELVDPFNVKERFEMPKLLVNAAVSFNVGFLDRVNGKINISIPSWTTAKLKEGRYVYDILFTSPGGKKEIVLEGRINVRAGISTGCDFSKPTSAQRLCIAVIDEADAQATSTFSTLWTQFRTNYPNRTFYLLQPTTAGFSVESNKTNII